MADPQFQPSAFTRALIAAANPNPTPEDLAIIAQAKAEAAEQGMSDYVSEALAGIAAAASSDADPAAPSGARHRAGRPRAGAVRGPAGRGG